jgi:hypothetical protein
MFDTATRTTLSAASDAVIPNGPAKRAIASSASARSSGMRPPRKRSGSTKPHTTNASVSVASLPPRP